VISSTFRDGRRQKRTQKTYRHAATDPQLQRIRSCNGSAAATDPQLQQIRSCNRSAAATDPQLQQIRSCNRSELVSAAATYQLLQQIRSCNRSAAASSQLQQIRSYHVMELQHGSWSKPAAAKRLLLQTSGCSKTQAPTKHQLQPTLMRWALHRMQRHAAQPLQYSHCNTPASHPLQFSRYKVNAQQRCCRSDDSRPLQRIRCNASASTQSLLQYRYDCLDGVMASRLYQQQRRPPDDTYRP
jgi:hypothetical protein